MGVFRAAHLLAQAVLRVAGLERGAGVGVEATAEGAQREAEVLVRAAVLVVLALVVAVAAGREAEAQGLALVAAQFDAVEPEAVGAVAAPEAALARLGVAEEARQAVVVAVAALDAGAALGVAEEAAEAAADAAALLAAGDVAAREVAVQPKGTLKVGAAALARADEVAEQAHLPRAAVVVLAAAFAAALLLTFSAT